jgi:Flp pilus assembly protein TadD/peroxiredoxin
MGRKKERNHIFSRRAFLRGVRFAPGLFVPAPLYGLNFPSLVEPTIHGSVPFFPFADLRIAPNYPTKSPLDAVLRYVAPGLDEFVTEKCAWEITKLLSEWGKALKAGPPALTRLAKFLDALLEAASLVPTEERPVRSGYGIDVLRRRFAAEAAPGREQFLRQMKMYLSAFSQMETAEFEIVGIEESAMSPLQVRADIRYDFVGTQSGGGREERIGQWFTHWSQDESGAWRAVKWQATEETVSRTNAPVFVDISEQALGQTESYKTQMLHGVDHWRTVLDGACGVDIYGNSGLAVGDFDGDGFDDFYVCQPAGLPNRLYRNHGDGSFEDVSERSGMDVLDSSACALFADFENRGRQDLLVVSASGPLFFMNEGDGKFSLKRDAFQFARLPQGTFTHAAVADYDGDGLLDIYFCVYSYYVGLDQYHYPVPYFDARNGPPNFLLHNEGNGTFRDRTEAAGLNVDNDRYSFACAWGDSKGGGRPDLYVANDFGRNNLYRNNGDGTFTSVAGEAGVEDAGAGMSAAWFDYDNDGRQDIYVANMWSSAGIRVSEQTAFQEKKPEVIRGMYRRHARGNSLYHNEGNGKFRNVSEQAGVEMGRWAWSSDAWDFDHDGYADLYVANGYISGPGETRREQGDVASFFWRQVVARSPDNAVPSPKYELGWNAINELIRSDATWNGCERNVFYANNRDGTFSEVSGAVGMDFPDDSRAFALADLDHDGRLEVILKNRNAPQLRVLRNVMKEVGNSLVLRLRGQKSNRDAIGAAVTVEAGALRQTKYLQGGSGFLSQHSKELFFGLEKNSGTARVSIRWPSGLTQSLERLPVNQRIDVEEGSADFVARPFATSPVPLARATESARTTDSSSLVETWLIQPLRAPDFSLPDLAGKTVDVRSLRGAPVLLAFCESFSADALEQLRLLQRAEKTLTTSGMPVMAINVDEVRDPAALRSLAGKFFFPTLLATPEVAGIFNIFYRYLFDRRRDMPIPTSLLVDRDGMIVKIYQGVVNPEHVVDDLRRIPIDAAERMSRALPFPGTLHQGAFQRNDFTYGVALFQRGYLEQAAAAFQQVIAAKPEEPEAYYNLGTLYLRRNEVAEARGYLEQAVKLRANYPEAWNNLGMVAAQESKTEEAVRNFRQSLLLRPDYATALLNLGNLERRKGNFAEAETLLKRALELEPDNAEVHYNLGMLYARQQQDSLAAQYLRRAVELRPEYPDALNNLGVFFVREQRYAEAEERFLTCIRVAPGFDQAYLNLARLYVILHEKEKARAVLQALLREQPQHKMAQQALEMLN